MSAEPLPAALGHPLPPPWLAREQELRARTVARPASSTRAATPIPVRVRLHGPDGTTGIVRGFVTGWTSTAVEVVWTSDTGADEPHLSCDWIAPADVRRLSP